MYLEELFSITLAAMLDSGISAQVDPVSVTDAMHLMTLYSPKFYEISNQYSTGNNPL